MVIEELSAEYTGHSGKLMRNREVLGKGFKFSGDENSLDDINIEKNKYSLFNQGDKNLYSGDGSYTTNKIDFPTKEEIKQGEEFRKSRSQKVKEYYQEKYKENFYDEAIPMGLGPFEYATISGILLKGILKGGFKFLIKKSAKQVVKRDVSKEARLVRELSEEAGENANKKGLKNLSGEIEEAAHKARTYPYNNVPGIMKPGQGVKAGVGESGIKDILSGLKSGSSSGVKIVDSTDELSSIFNKMTEGGKTIEWPKYKGNVVQLSDGTQVGLRTTSKSGGATIDIRFPNGSFKKVHVK
jgi:hypothetical protein